MKKIPNTFNLLVYANNVITVETVDQLYDEYQKAQNEKTNVLILGKGSNTLFTENFNGKILLNRIKGISITEDDDNWFIKVGSGELWHDLVRYLIEKQIFGLENLALIPGTVGSAPIQNIGAYGVEFEKFSDYVDLLNLTKGKIITVTDGKYGYRESIFKSDYLNGFAVVSVGIKLPKKWKPTLDYGELKNFDEKSVTSKMIFDKICEVRQSKLPDPNVLGNGGSFFKNPIITNDQFKSLKVKYPNMPFYPQPNYQIKLAAGWLIDQCGLKKHQIGGAAVHENQALVLINKERATPEDIILLAKFVRDTVKNKFDIELTPEIRFIGKNGEINAVSLLSNSSN